MSKYPTHAPRTPAATPAGEPIAAGLPRVARGLAWFSIALGLAELCAPRALSRAVGIDARATTMRLYGLRELACGIGILAAPQPQRFLWGRVLGDVLDLGSTAAAARSGRTRAGRGVLATSTALVSIGALDVYAARATAASQSGQRVDRSLRDYSSRSGFPQMPQAMRGAALADFQIPDDMRTPEALRPYAAPTRNTMRQ